MRIFIQVAIAASAVIIVALRIPKGGVIRFQNGAAVVEDKNFERVLVPLESLAAKGMQLAYSATAHDYQGSSVDRVLLAMESSGQLANQQAFYVGLSRMRDDTQLITDDPAKLQSNIERQTGDKIAAHDGLQKTALESNEKTASEEAKIRDEKEAQKEPQIDPKTNPEQTSIFDVLNGKDRDSGSAEISKDDREKDPRKDRSVSDLLGDIPRTEMPADLQKQLDQWTEKLEREKGERTR